MLARREDDRRAVRDGGVRVVHDDRRARRERLAHEAVLLLLALARVRHQIFADVAVRRGEPLAIEGRLARAGQPDEDHALHGITA